MMVLITYDVSTTSAAGQRRLRMVAKQCQNWGQRVQNSVFEGDLTKVELKKVKETIKELIEEDKDSVRVYILRSDKYLQTEELGTNKVDISEII